MAGGQPLFHREQGPVDAASFLHDVHRLAATLPGARHLVNLCRDRYAFAVSFAAGLMRGCTSLLNADPAGLQALSTRYPDCLVLADGPLSGCPLPVVTVSLAETPGHSTENPAIPSDHLAAIVFTSGSTGVPVAHPKHWGELVARSRAAAAQFELSGGTVIGTVPPQHMYGFETTVLLPLHAPVGSWCGPTFFPADIAALPPCPEPRVLVTTPLQLRLLLQADLDLPIDAFISATAPLDPVLAAGAETRWDAPVMEIFGATECGSIASRRVTTGPDWKPYPGIQLLIEDASTTVLAEGMAPVALADLLQATPTGFRLLGRRTDVVKLAGRRASLPGLNQVLTALPGVEDGAFVVPDDLDNRSSARLVAVVVAPGRSAPAILADLRQRIDPVFLPRRVIQVNSMPRNALGKLPRQALLDLVAGAR